MNDMLMDADDLKLDATRSRDELDKSLVNMTSNLVTTISMIFSRVYSLTFH